MMKDFPKEHDDEMGPLTVREMKTQQREDLQEACDRLGHDPSDEKKVIE